MGGMAAPSAGIRIIQNCGISGDRLLRSDVKSDRGGAAPYTTKQKKI